MGRAGSGRLADLAETETFAVIQPDQDLFRQAATKHLLPILASLRKLPKVRAVPIGPPDAQGWVAIEWAAPRPGGRRVIGRDVGERVCSELGCIATRQGTAMTIHSPAGCGGHEGATGPGRQRGARRSLLGLGCAALLAPVLASASGIGSGAGAGAGARPRNQPTVLDRAQSQCFREWMTVLIHTQIERGPTPRWTHRDCAGLVRFAVAESLRDHDTAWKRANGLAGTRVPPDLDAPTVAPLRNAWRRVDGTRAAFVGALELVQENTRFVSRELTQATAGDLLFYDMGDEQHLMVWMGRYLAYHTGHTDAHDNGLRAIRPAQLLAWNDTRWRPVAENPNFAGLHRLDFLS